MKFKDLDDRAKQKARDWFNTTVFVDSSDWDHIYEDAVRIGALMGLMVGTRVVKLVKGASYDEPDISFSGFCSQGDGACWAGHIEVDKMADCVQRVRDHTGANEPLVKLAERAEAIHADIVATFMAERLADDSDKQYPECHPNMRLIVKSENWRCFRTMVDNDDIPDTVLEAVNSWVEDFASWIYDSLEAEHDHQMDEEYVDSALTDGGYNFDEDGTVR